MRRERDRGKTLLRATICAKIACWISRFHSGHYLPIRARMDWVAEMGEAAVKGFVLEYSKDNAAETS